MHTLTWLIWLGAALAATMLAPSPLYYCLVFLAATQVFLSWRRDSPLARSFGLFVRVGAYVCAGYILFSVITVGGARGQTVLLRLPALTLPGWLGGVVLGGPITAETLAWGASRGLGLWTLMVVFGAFNALVDHHRLLRLAPRSLFHAGLAVTIAIGFVPGLLRAIAEIGQAQRARGHRFGGPRSWPPLVAPLLAGSLEKSIQLAEALDARGYGRAAAPAGLWRQIALIGSVPLLGAGAFIWLYYGLDAALPALALGAAGVLGAAAALRGLGAYAPRSVYRRERWRRRDTLATMACAAALLGLAALRLAGYGDLVYYPFPHIAAPGFNLLAGLAVMLLAAPALAGGREPPPRPRGRERAGVARRAEPDQQAGSSTGREPAAPSSAS
jgi:energy-coupling factor transport system permease protein